jgi:hypothetical protein
VRRHAALDRQMAEESIDIGIASRVSRVAFHQQWIVVR